jgi:hypothetical protein
MICGTINDDCAADSRHILSGSGDRRAKLWDANSGI